MSRHRRCCRRRRRRCRQRRRPRDHNKFRLKLKSFVQHLTHVSEPGYAIEPVIGLNYSYSTRRSINRFVHLFILSLTHSPMDG